MAADSLLVLVVVPLMLGVACLFLKENIQSFIKSLTLIISAGALALVSYLYLNKPMAWPAKETSVFFMDNLSGLAALAVSFFALIIAVYSVNNVQTNIVRFFSYFLVTLGASLGVTFSNHLIILVIFWGLLALTLYLMVNLAQTNFSGNAAKKALLIVGGTDSLMILGVCLIWVMTGTLSMDKIHLSITGGLTLTAYILILCAILAKVGAVPFHTWFPDVAESAPTPVTAYLPASLDKILGIYLLARISLNLFASHYVLSVILLLTGAVTILVAASLAIFQKDLKRLLGYCAVSQVGYMMIGIATGNPLGIIGGLFHMMNHALYKSSLFLISGVVQNKTGTTDLDRLGGLSKYLPVSFVCFLIGALAVSGVPPLNGFISKWMVYQGIIEYGRQGHSLWIVALVAAMFGSAFTMASFMKLVHAVFLGRVSKEYSQIKEAGFFTLLPMAVLSVLCVVFGLAAFRVPLKCLIIPATGLNISYAGLWNPLLATSLLVTGLGIGFLGYLFNKKMRSREVPPFIGGENIEGFDKLSGVDFYNTVKKEEPFVHLYGKDDEMGFVRYIQKKKFMIVFTRVLQDLHNGVLPTQMVWALLGMVLMFFAMFYWIR